MLEQLNELQLLASCHWVMTVFWCSHKLVKLARASGCELCGIISNWPTSCGQLSSPPNHSSLLPSSSHHHPSILTPSLHPHTITPPSSHHHPSILTPSLHPHTITPPSSHHHPSILTPSLHPHTITTPSSHRHPLFAPSPPSHTITLS